MAVCMNEGRHDGRCAIVTGAGRGAGRIGAGIARRFAEGGARLVVADFDARVTETADEIATATKREIAAFAAYNAAKGGVHGMTTGLAREFACYDITVNTVAPCVVHTERLETALRDDPARARHFIGVIPKARGAETGEIAAYVDFLASTEAAFVTGQVVSVNGGSTML
jgi:NAD(P)-dependent dehydrogenase (short-subunit alcohol dehydrogenase family)